MLASVPISRAACAEGGELVFGNPDRVQLGLAESFLQDLGSEAELGRVFGGDHQQAFSIDQPGGGEVQFEPCPQLLGHGVGMIEQALHDGQGGERSSQDDDLERVGGAVEQGSPLCSRLSELCGAGAFQVDGGHAIDGHQSRSWQASFSRMSG